MGYYHSDREHTCPKCGGWLEGDEDGDCWACDTCGYVYPSGADDNGLGEDKPA